MEGRRVEEWKEEGGEEGGGEGSEELHSVQEGFRFSFACSGALKIRFISIVIIIMMC